MTDSKTDDMKARDVWEKQAEEKRVIERGDIEEIAEFYDETDTGEFDWDEDEPENRAVAFRPELEQISVRLPKEDVEALKRRAKRSGVGYTTILRMIVHEHVNSPLNG
jgi:predicted DNA binding CopG/RHH family protein